MLFQIYDPKTEICPDLLQSPLKLCLFPSNETKKMRIRLCCKPCKENRCFPESL